MQHRYEIAHSSQPASIALAGFFVHAVYAALDRAFNMATCHCGEADV
jgi:hypothetical protein